MRREKVILEVLDYPETQSLDFLCCVKVFQSVFLDLS